MISAHAIIKKKYKEIYVARRVLRVCVSNIQHSDYNEILQLFREKVCVGIFNADFTLCILSARLIFFRYLVDVTLRHYLRFSLAINEP